VARVPRQATEGEVTLIVWKPHGAWILLSFGMLWPDFRIAQNSQNMKILASIILGF
jgi:hypothetical protein